MTDLYTVLLPMYRDLAPSTRSSYRASWRGYLAYCGQVGIDPLKCSVPQGQAWVDSMVHRGTTPAAIQRHVGAVRSTLEHLAMMGYQPYEPFTRGMVATPKVVPRITPLHDHEVLTDERIALALFHSRADDRAHGVLWACAGMGLGNADVRNVNDSRLKRVGATVVAVVPRSGRGHLIPVPRELCLIVERSGWPIRSTATYGDGGIAKAVAPYVHTSAKDLRDFHRDCAIRLGVDPQRVHQGMNDHRATDRTRFGWSDHPSTIVCAHLHELLIDIAAR